MIENNLLLDTAERLKSITSEYYRCVYMPLLEERQRKTQALYKEFEIKREP